MAGTCRHALGLQSQEPHAVVVLRPMWKAKAHETCFLCNRHHPARYGCLCADLVDFAVWYLVVGNVVIGFDGSRRRWWRADGQRLDVGRLDSRRLELERF